MVSLDRASLTKLARFGTVGGIGTLIDACITVALIHRGLDPLIARVFAIGIAVMTTWRLNRAITFDATSSQSREGLRYVMVAATSMSVNYGIFATLILTVPGIWPAFAVVCATSVSMVISFLGYNYFAFRAAA